MDLVANGLPLGGAVESAGGALGVSAPMGSALDGAGAEVAAGVGGDCSLAPHAATNIERAIHRVCIRRKLARLLLQKQAVTRFVGQK